MRETFLRAKFLVLYKNLVSGLKVACSFLKKETSTQVFSYIFFQAPFYRIFSGDCLCVYLIILLSLLVSFHIFLAFYHEQIDAAHKPFK